MLWSVELQQHLQRGVAGPGQLLQVHEQQQTAHEISVKANFNND